MMRVRFIPLDPTETLTSATHIPDKFKKYFQPNTERTFYKASCYEYLEQRYLSEDCTLCYLDFEIHESCTVQPMAKRAMLAIVYMVSRSIPCYLFGYGEIIVNQGYAYLFYLPENAKHQAHFEKGHYRVMYCYISQSYFDNMASENPGIADLLDQFKSESPASLLEKPALIDSDTLYQLWLIKECKESKAYREAYLKSRVLDLVLDYVKSMNRNNDKIRKISVDIVSKSERIFKAKKLIDEDVHGKLIIKDIADIVRLNEQQLKRGFKSHFGITMGKYQTSAKVALACKLLTETEMAISEIAYAIGYEDKSSLTRIFLQELKLTPRQYRNNSKRTSEDGFFRIKK